MTVRHTLYSGCTCTTPLANRTNGRAYATIQCCTCL